MKSIPRRLARRGNLGADPPNLIAVPGFSEITGFGAHSELRA